MDEWMTAEEQEPVEVWGHRVLEEFGPEWVYESACALDPSVVVEHGDETKPARKGRMMRDERWDDGLPRGFVFEKPFGERAA